MIRLWVSSLIAGTAFVAGSSCAAEILRLPDGSWIGPPVVVEGKLHVQDEPEVVWMNDAYKLVKHPWYRINFGPRRPWLRAIYDGLPELLQKQIKSPPTTKPRTTFFSPVNKALLFPCNGSKFESNYDFAFLDEGGHIGCSDTQLQVYRSGDLLGVQGVLPRLSATITLAAWAKESRSHDKFSMPPISMMRFRNPLHASTSSAPEWPDGKRDLVQKWRGLTFTLTKAVRGEERHQTGTKTTFEYLVEGKKSLIDYNLVRFLVEDNRGNIRHYGFGATGDNESLRISEDGHLLWPDNLNWRVRFFLTPQNPTFMHAAEYSRVRVAFPDPTKLEPRIIAPVLDLNGTILRNLRISPDPQPVFSFDKPVISRSYHPAMLEFEVVKTPSPRVIQAFHFHDGVLPFTERFQEVNGVSYTSLDRSMKSDASGSNPADRLPLGAIASMKLQIALDKSADFLEFVIAATPVETLEFYFQPELITAK